MSGSNPCCEWGCILGGPKDTGKGGVSSNTLNTPGASVSALIKLD